MSKEQKYLIIEGGEAGLSATNLAMFKKELGQDLIILDSNSEEAKKAMKDANVRLSGLEPKPFKIEALPDAIAVAYVDVLKDGKPSKEQRRAWNKQNYKKK